MLNDLWQWFNEVWNLEVNSRGEVVTSPREVILRFAMMGGAALVIATVVRRLNHWLNMGAYRHRWPEGYTLDRDPPPPPVYVGTLRALWRSARHEWQTWIVEPLLDKLERTYVVGAIQGAARTTRLAPLAGAPTRGG